MNLMQTLGVSAGSTSPDRARVVRHTTNEQLAKQNAVCEMTGHSSS